MLEDDADVVIGDDGEDTIYSVEFENGVKADFRWRDLRPL